MISKVQLINVFWKRTSQDTFHQIFKWFFLLFLFMFTNFVYSNSKEFKSPPYTFIAADLINKTSKEFEKSYNLVAIGSGGAMRHNISELSLSFNCYSLMKIEEGRDLIVECVNKFLNNINSEEKILPYLKPNPFTYSNIELMIAFYQKNQSDPPEGELYTIHFYGGNIYYKSFSKEKQFFTLKIESFQEAINKIQNN